MRTKIPIIFIFAEHIGIIYNLYLDKVERFCDNFKMLSLP